MTRQEDLKGLLEGISQNLDGFIGASVVDIASGMSLESTTKVPEFDLDIAAAYNAEMVKAKFKTMKALNITSELVDMLLTLDDQLHLIRMLEDRYFLYAAVYSSGTNLAMLRAVVNAEVKKYA
ncbi:hypothetical protein QP027_03845 [Corynebacterium breve]|uniref:Roadblock/LAMTOR2 domain-containing protein n=1 Tax=Corynebacterium breve TaxID=3049799 RepID=A0ABY8VHI9_9CORY|nr:hypothetical protein [Corynebacterium breve]WIM68537.1 hypothetical protein QP027_03845 [Corynebacterium breve]